MLTPRLALITERALEDGTESALSARLGLGPLADLPGRIVANVLSMTARKLRHPMSLVIEIKAGYDL